MREWRDPKFPKSLTDAEKDVVMSDLVKQIISDDKACPSCGSKKVVKKGHTLSGKQRFKCSSCSSTFIVNHSQLFPNSHIDPQSWIRFCQIYLNGGTLRHCSKECDVCLKTSFSMKHRLIDILRTSEGYPGMLFFGESFFDYGS